MALAAPVIVEIANIVDDAQTSNSEIVQVTDAYPGMEMADAYAVQAELQRRWESRGRAVVGYKGRLTSKTKMIQMGVNDPVFGVLLSDTNVAPTARRLKCRR